ncbi:hypothetical protein BDY17DRAFT_288311 [Neohortaea acidophila]|uniref:Uncharacterized protein n=1 Tax=Neohortaea acidophila TaxID=245834 RepID=A0A6A6Q3R1_9PEZI|nr:uncharacterized protein BDY17DRAFT_288311 [Neohortaea acidophila]KAF2487088.1 hypothetical protein BDY17DRAFT_288311 [Neohortaea acidophila]
MLIQNTNARTTKTSQKSSPSSELWSHGDTGRESRSGDGGGGGDVSAGWSTILSDSLLRGLAAEALKALCRSALEKDLCRSSVEKESTRVRVRLVVVGWGMVEVIFAVLLGWLLSWLLGWFVSRVEVVVCCRWWFFGRGKWRCDEIWRRGAVRLSDEGEEARCERTLQRYL